MFGFGNSTVTASPPSPATIGAAGTGLKNAVKSAQSVAEALNVVSKQLSEAATNLRKNAPAIANTAATVAKNVSGAPVVASMFGGYNAAMINAVPRSVLAGGAKNAVNEAANQLKNLSSAAKSASKAVNSAVATVGAGANYVANNIHKVKPAAINMAISKANGVIGGAVNGINSVAERRIAPNMRVNANVGKNHMNAVKNVAKTVSNMARGGRKSKTRRSRR